MLHPEFFMLEEIHVIWSEPRKCKASLLPYSMGHTICFYGIAVGARVRVGTLHYTSLWSCSAVFNTVVIWIHPSFDLSVQALWLKLGEVLGLLKAPQTCCDFDFSTRLSSQFLLPNVVIPLAWGLSPFFSDNSPTWDFSFSDGIGGRWLGKLWAPSLFLYSSW